MNFLISNILKFLGISFYPFVAVYTSLMYIFLRNKKIVYQPLLFIVNKLILNKFKDE